MQTTPRRRNPSGAWGLRPDPASLVVDDHSGRLPPRSLAAARKPHARDSSHYSDRLLGYGRQAAPRRNAQSRVDFADRRLAASTGSVIR